MKRPSKDSSSLISIYIEKIKVRIYSLILGRSAHAYKSYSQAGEDRIISFLFQVMGIINPRYLDVGANHPEKFSNTCFFYKSGSSGVCIEPNPLLWKEFSRARPRDITLNTGIGNIAGEGLPFYCFGPEADGLSTFSEANAKATEKSTPYKIREVLKVPVVTINSILEKYFQSVPELLSIDVEGLDQAILESLDFQKYAPIVICAETHSQEDGKFLKDQEFIVFVKSKGYVAYSDTYINTIFLRDDYYNRFFA